MRINTGCWMNGCKCFDPDDEDGVGIKKDREWVGLTDEDIQGIHYQIKTKGMGAYSTEDIYHAIEAKLKDKNR